MIYPPYELRMFQQHHWLLNGQGGPVVLFWDGANWYDPLTSTEVMTHDFLGYYNECVFPPKSKSQFDYCVSRPQ
jgi:hypothetical protein